MKVNIGKYKSSIGPYEISDLLRHVGVSEDTCDKFGLWLSKQKTITNVLSFVDKFRPRKVNVKIDHWDTWSADHTLSLIIHPLLVELSKDKRGVPHVDMEDVPENLRFVSGTDSGTEEWDKESIFWMQRRWEWIVGEMIFAHAAILDDEGILQFHHGDPESDFKLVSGTEGSDDAVYEYVTKNPDYWFDREGYEKYNERIDNGLRLFGKYYRCLWT